MVTSALNSFLKPLSPYLQDDLVSEVIMNRECELFVEREGIFECYQEPSLNKERVIQMAELIAEYNHKTISPYNPLLSATLPDGARCQFILPPACDLNQVIFSIRKPSMHEIELKDWFKNGLLTLSKKEDIHQELIKLKEQDNLSALIEKAVLGKCNIIVSGGTSTAKTTFLNSCLKIIPLEERIITIEDVRETKTKHQNVAHLLAMTDDEAQLPHKTSMLDLLKASLRLRPDRIFLSELRGSQAYPFLRASISGHPGSITTLHADSIEHAKTQLKFMLAESQELAFASNERLNDLIESSVDVIVQMGRAGGMRAPSDIYIKGMS